MECPLSSPCKTWQNLFSHRLSMGLDVLAELIDPFPSFFDGKAMGLTNQPPDLLPVTLRCE